MLEEELSQRRKGTKCTEEGMEDYEKKEASIRLISELEKGRISGEKEGWYSLEEIKKEFCGNNT